MYGALCNVLRILGGRWYSAMIVFTVLTGFRRTRRSGTLFVNRTMDDNHNITRLLRAAADGDKQSSDQLYQSVYDQLLGIAKRQRRNWNGNETISTVALLNEAYMKMSPPGNANFADRAHFFATAATAMRQILINYAQRSRRQKRGGDAIQITWSEQFAIEHDTIEELLQIDILLRELRSDNERSSKVFECRVFGGMTIEETATALNISPATVKRDWKFASSWVYARLDD